MVHLLFEWPEDEVDVSKSITYIRKKKIRSFNNIKIVILSRAYQHYTEKLK